MYKCASCRKEKPANEFYPDRNPKRNRPVAGYCKECARLKKRLSTHKLKSKEYAKNYKKRKPIQYKISNDKYKANNLIAIRARDYVKTAIRRHGLRKFPCEVCGKSEWVHAHHRNGYSMKHILDIEWLCPLHHKAREKGLTIEEAKNY